MKLSKLLMLFLATIMFSCGGEKQTTSSTTSNQDVQKTEKQPEEPVFIPDFGDLLVELESNMGWNSVNPDWKMRRDSWIESCFAVTETSEKASLLTEFETYVEWSAVNPDWSDRRDLWIEEVLSAQSEGELGKLLAEFESYVLWDVVSPNWVSIRDRWIKDCENLTEGSW